MTQENKNIFEIKPRIYGISIDIRALWARLFFKKETNPLLIIPARVLQIFKDHGVAISQIPRLIPGLSLKDLNSHESLLAALTPEIIKQIAELFKIQVKWLEGTTDAIYENGYYCCYKNPWRFFEDINLFKIDRFEEPLIAFTSVPRLDYKSGKDQFVLLVQREICANLDGKIIYRYRIIDQFLWGYYKSRIQLKAMIRIWYKRFEIPVNIYKISSHDLEKMESGKIVPDLYLKRRKQLTDVALEDFSLMPEEDRVSKENEELSEVLEYINVYRLEDMKGENPMNSQETAKYWV
jgi:hypothetical protein